jgi:tripartite-type tricarboxylate transporter receptor subunit TctC
LLHTHLAFDPLKDLVPVGLIGDAPQLLVVNADLPVKTFQDFLNYARARPGQIAYGSAGTGSLMQIGAEQLARLAGLQLVHVPYRGAIPGITDMITGRIQMMHISLNPTVAHIRAGSLRPLVVTDRARWTEHLPDVPTSAEAGLPDYEMDIWFGLVAPRGTPKPVLDQLNTYLRAMVADPQMRRKIVDGYLRPASMTADAFAAFIAKDTPRWEKIIKQSGAVAD